MEICKVSVKEVFATQEVVFKFRKNVGMTTCFGVLLAIKVYIFDRDVLTILNGTGSELIVSRAINMQIRDELG